MEGEWVRVKSRNRRSERPPVRQIYPRRGATRIGEMHRAGRANEHGKGKVVSWPKGKLVQSFLVRNFPPDCSTGELIAKCHEAGPVVDLYCPLKLDVKGKRFCFVRVLMDNEDQVEEILSNLNSLWIDSFKFQAFVPQYERKDGEKADFPRKGKEMEQGMKIKATEPPWQHAENAVAKGRSFAQVVKEGGCSCRHRQDTHLPWKTSFFPNKDEMVWLNNTKVGKLKPTFSWEDYREDLQDEIQGAAEVRHLGDNLILILSMENAESQQGKEVELENFWFSWVRPWKTNDVSKRREVWTSWYGVPLHAWSERFSKRLARASGLS